MDGDHPGRRALSPSPTATLGLLEGRLQRDGRHVGFFGWDGVDQPLDVTVVLRRDVSLVKVVLFLLLVGLVVVVDVVAAFVLEVVLVNLVMIVIAIVTHACSNKQCYAF